MNILRKIKNWVLTSSQNPSEVSLTLKGFLIGLIPGIMTFFGIAHLAVGTDVVTNLFNAIVAFVQDVLTVVATAAMLFGAARKLYFAIFPPKVSGPIAPIE